MKKNLHVLVFLFSLILSISSLIAQQKEDIVYLLDGGQKKAKYLQSEMKSSSLIIQEKNFNMNLKSH